MKYDAKEVRDQTLRECNRSRLGWLWITLIGIFYICVSCGAFNKKHPHLTPKEILTTHFIDALLWNHDIKIENPLEKL